MFYYIGTHGGALTLPSLHSFVTAYTLIKPDGSLKIISKQHDPILFSAMAPSLGLFGAVVEMEMKVVPLQILEARMKVLSFDELVDKRAAGFLPVRGGPVIAADVADHYCYCCYHHCCRRLIAR